MIHRGTDEERPPAPGTARRLLWWPVGLVGVAAVVRVAVILVFVPTYRPVSDAHQYLELAGNFAGGRGFAMRWPQMAVHPTAFRPPAWPVLLSGWVEIFGASPSAARYANVIIGSAVVAVVYLLGRRAHSHRAGVVAAALVALFPPLVANDTTTLSEPLGLLVGLLVVVAFAGRRPLVAGVLLGLLVLTKPSGQLTALVLVLTAPFLLAAGGLDGATAEATRSLRQRWRRGLGVVGLAALGAIVVVGPWMVRNDIEVGTASVVTSNGFNLTAVYSDRSRAAGEFIDPVYDERNQSLAERLLRFDEARWNSALTRRGLDGVRAQPTYVARVAGRNVLSWFELTPGSNDSPEALDGRVPLLRTVGLPLFYVIVPLGLAGFWLAFRHAPRSRTIVGAMAAIAVSTMVASLPLVAVPRLRGPFDLACCFGVGLLVAVLTDRTPPTVLPGDEVLGSGVVADER